ncbi:radical SAM protein [candidate division WOR-1 bacterium RIFOXYA12_FULL_43_27]|uniref:GTP 3',8-cyclase n=1 Tax=candidate division WOR-1 bacterium RIFOXYC2_FULL_46_14 TaxID=1802587 RepID=A0A1F4U5E7_UNCSA|nr:MAG: radical SAM protein [candidate division WOR-1 bacterium RIFOXYA12_FULL_43_27]OGC20349.1 MAG: radical SAM protein [candidate division WOR-1 bacterium RIFOXYB2_FULL_46_45]OGC31914.1 MAG: radical SAM protein [candidate division WOR-1 bacterium RIFOXYA2_FULL_46_56]OGC40195.1 MAG: radical SAM protein [candidate division WOR-1 bacterium RIFOXYC2_FULL_46_14]
MLDQYNRDIYYLRIAVTDLCNLRCTYCMPEEGIKLKKHEEILNFEEIVEIVKVAVSLGFYKFRLTGGEPLVRRGIIDLVKMLAQIDGVKTLAMTTNGLLLPQFAKQLKAAGLSRLNISLDSLNKERYNKITRGGELADALAGIKSAREAGFEKTKLNAVIVDGFNDDEKDNLKKFADENKMKIRFVKKMDLKSGDYYGVEGGEGGNCSICNRVRLTADGKLRSCLFSDYEVDVRTVGIERAFRQVIENKPEKGDKSLKREMIQIGG